MKGHKSEQDSTPLPGNNYNPVFLCGRWEPGPWCLQAHHHYEWNSRGGSILCVPSPSLSSSKTDVSAQVAFSLLFTCICPTGPESILNNMATPPIYSSLLKCHQIKHYSSEKQHSLAQNYSTGIWAIRYDRFKQENKNSPFTVKYHRSEVSQSWYYQHLVTTKTVVGGCPCAL